MACCREYRQYLESAQLDREVIAPEMIRKLVIVLYLALKELISRQILVARLRKVIDRKTQKVVEEQLINAMEKFFCENFFPGCSWKPGQLDAGLDSESMDWFALPPGLDD